MKQIAKAILVSLLCIHKVCSAVEGTNPVISTGVRPRVNASRQTGIVALPGGRVSIGLDDFGPRGWVKLVAIPLDPTGIRPEAGGMPSFGGYYLDDGSGAQRGKAFAAPVGDAWATAGRHLAVTLDPRFGEVATRVDSAAHCRTSPPVYSATGNFECYRIVVAVALKRGGENGEFGIFHNTGAIAVRSFANNGERQKPDVVLANLHGAFERLHYNGNGVVSGFEPTMTADSRLLIVQVLEGRGGRGHAFLFNPYPWNSSGWSAPVPLAKLHRSGGKVFCINPSKKLAHCPASERTSLRERYPIARKPFLLPNGQRVSENGFHIFGYPWIDFDGANIFFQAWRRSAYSVVGRDTQYRIKLIDGPHNLIRNYQRPGATPAGCPTSPNYLCKGLTRTFSPGNATGFWATYPEANQWIFPYTRQTPLTFVFLTNPLLQGKGDASYGEVNHHDFVDGDYLLYLHMNEQVRQNHAFGHNRIETTFDLWTGRTPDTSGNDHSAILQGGATFPQEYTKTDNLSSANPGFVGRAVYFPEGSQVRVDASPALNHSRARLTVELAVKPLFKPNGGRRLIEKPGAWEIRVNSDLRPTVTLRIGKIEYETGAIGPALRVGAWNHLMFAYRKNGKQRFQFYVNGREVLGAGREELKLRVSGKPFKPASELPHASVAASTGNLLIGPGSSSGKAGGRKAVFLIDEVAVSRVDRNEEYAAVQAFAERDIPWLDEDSGNRYPRSLPLGLKKSDLRLPDSIVGLIKEKTFSAAVNLGEKLFHEKGLSTNEHGKAQGISCASCHNPRKGFADNRQVAVGVSKKKGERNVPSLINRGMGIAQFFDMRSPNLVAQALRPVENPLEMNGDLNEVADFLMDRQQGYLGGLEKVLGKKLNTVPTQKERRELILRGVSLSLASYMTTILSGNSLVDRIRTNRLTAQERNSGFAASVERGLRVFEGKGRCTACHGGPNFTDELVHNTGTGDAADPGRVAVTGLDKDRGAFKTPTLRGLTLTEPYFHDGRFGRLDQVVEFYNQGGGASATDPEVRRLHLSKQEKGDLVHFLEALEGEVSSGL